VKWQAAMARCVAGLVLALASPAAAFVPSSVSPALPEEHVRGAFAQRLPEMPEPETSSISFQSLAAGLALGLLVGLAGAAPAKAITNPTYEDYLAQNGLLQPPKKATRAERAELLERAPAPGATKAEKLAWRKEYFQKVYYESSNYDKDKLGVIKQGTGQWARMKYDVAKPVFPPPVEVGKAIYVDGNVAKLKSQEANKAQTKIAVEKFLKMTKTPETMRILQKDELFADFDDSRSPFKVRDSLFHR